VEPQQIVPEKVILKQDHGVTAERQQDVNLQIGVHGLVMSQMVLVVHRQATETSHQHISMLSSKTTAMELYRHVPQGKPIQDNTVCVFTITVNYRIGRLGM